MTESGTATPSAMGTGSKKFDYLLQQTELFSHFMGTSQKVSCFLKCHLTRNPRLLGARISHYI